ncbi:Mrs2p [Sugiyamaella lignohabitans]|uniref:Magnesium transporter n=1 Tax=Sugiyamaella lignohabitans TaxID=796027 RepID=A0A167EH30_9ASCO|nr:Mrs2p [Sugiyamaella lignohabitans]ANB14074.1 Mrs2p [Sugiyamaella lignohabitans]
MWPAGSRGGAKLQYLNSVAVRNVLTRPTKLPRRDSISLFRRLDIRSLCHVARRKTFSHNRNLNSSQLDKFQPFCNRTIVHTIFNTSYVSGLNTRGRHFSNQESSPGKGFGESENISFLPPNFNADGNLSEEDYIFDWATEQLSREIGSHGPTTEISCTVLDEHGKVVEVSKKFSRKDFLAEHNLHPRDLRNIDSPKVRLIPSILVRKDCILVNMLELRAAIRHNQVLIFDSVDKGNKSLIAKLSLLVYDLENKLGSCTGKQDDIHGFAASQSYELKALECILMHAVANLDIELKGQLSVLNGILVNLEDHVDRDLLQELLVRNKAMALFYQKILLIRNVINELLDNDEDLVAMYLSEKVQGIERASTDHAEAELLLEAYYKQVDEIVQQAEQVISNVKSTEEIINIMLDSNRNSLMLFELKIMIGTLGFTIAMFFAALYGMNLKNFMEESDYGFTGTTVVICAIAGVVTVLNFKKLAIVKRVTLIGHGGDSPIPRRFLHGSQRLKQALPNIPTGNPVPLPRKRFWHWSRRHTRRNEYDHHKRAVMWRWLVEKRDA